MHLVTGVRTKSEAREVYTMGNVLLHLPWLVSQVEVLQINIYLLENTKVLSWMPCVLVWLMLAFLHWRTPHPPLPRAQEIVSAEGNGTWTEFPPDSRLSAPECIETLWSRDNHLGNTIGGFPISYNWTIPDLTHEHCVLRIRWELSKDSSVFLTLFSW